MLAAGAFWFLGVYGLARFFAMQYRMWAGDTVFQVRGLRVLVDRIPVALPDLAGKSGNFRGLIWRGIDDGLACRARGRIFVVGHCRASGEQTLFEAVVPVGMPFAWAELGKALSVVTGDVVVNLEQLGPPLRPTEHVLEPAHEVLPGCGIAPDDTRKPAPRVSVRNHSKERMPYSVTWALLRTRPWIAPI